MEIYFDTNVYDFIARQQEELIIRNFLDSNNLRVKVSSGNLYEILATANPDHRLAQVAAVVIIASTYEDFPQSWMHAEEVRSEIARCHPAWLRYAPSSRLLRKAEGFLDQHRTLWNKIRSLDLPPPEDFALYQRDAQQGIEKNVAFQGAMKHGIRTAGTKFSVVASGLGKTTVIQPDKELTADEYWRYECMMVWFNAIARKNKESRDYADWLLPYLKDDVFLGPTYQKFWAEEVDPVKVTKNRIVALTGYYQMLYKLSPGNAGDQIHASILTDVDLFITADKRFYRVLNTIVAHHYPSIGKPLLISREGSALAALQKVLS